MKKVLFYTNQFFGQIGGEAEAYQKPFIEQVGLESPVQISVRMPCRRCT